VIVREFIGFECPPILAALRRNIAGKLAVPEIKGVKVQRAGIVTPDHAEVGHIEVIIPFTVQPEFRIVKGPRYYQACQFVVIEWFNGITGASVCCLKAGLAAAALHRWSQRFVLSIHRIGKTVTQHECRNQQRQRRIEYPLVQCLEHNPVILQGQVTG